MKLKKHHLEVIAIYLRNQKRDNIEPTLIEEIIQLSNVLKAVGLRVETIRNLPETGNSICPTRK